MVFGFLFYWIGEWIIKTVYITGQSSEHPIINMLDEFRVTNKCFVIWKFRKLKLKVFWKLYFHRESSQKVSIDWRRVLIWRNVFSLLRLVWTKKWPIWKYIHRSKEHGSCWNVHGGWNQPRRSSVKGNPGKTEKNAHEAIHSLHRKYLLFWCYWKYFFCNLFVVGFAVLMRYCRIFVDSFCLFWS